MYYIPVMPALCFQYEMNGGVISLLCVKTKIKLVIDILCQLHHLAAYL